MSGTRPAGDEKGHDLALGTREEIEALHAEIERLPEKYRTAIVFCDLQGLTHEEAARRLGRPVGTVSARLSRARERLRSRLSRRGLALPAVATAAVAVPSVASAMPPELVDSTIRIAMNVSAGLTVGAVPASLATLSQEVLRSMFLAKLKAMSATLLLAGAVVGSVAVVAQEGFSSKPSPKAGGGTQKPADSNPTQAEEYKPDDTESIVRSAANLRRIAVGIHAYVDANGRFPASAIFGADGKPLLSWRVAILPYIGEKSLFAQFKLDEPWDGPHNKALLEKMPRFTPQS